MNANSTLGMLQQPVTAQDLEARQAIMHRLIDMAADNRIWGAQRDDNPMKGVALADLRRGYDEIGFQLSPESGSIHRLLARHVPTEN